MTRFKNTNISNSNSPKSFQSYSEAETITGAVVGEGAPTAGRSSSPSPSTSSTLTVTTVRMDDQDYGGQHDNDDSDRPIEELVAQTLVESIDYQKNTLEPFKDIRKTIYNNLKRSVHDERNTRNLTLTFKKSDSVTESFFVKIITQEYVDRLSKPVITYWFNKLYIFAKFIDRAEKLCFVDWLQTARQCGNVRYSMLQRNKDATHFKRRPVCISLQRVNSSIRTTKIHRTLKHLMNLSCFLSDPREGQEIELNRSNGARGGSIGDSGCNSDKARTISWLVDANAFRKIFIDLNGSVPYATSDSTVRSKRLRFRINCKPRACKHCYVLGAHKCRGRFCLKCGSKAHHYAKCRSTQAKLCMNCKRRGHLSNDSRCPKYIWALTRELFKMDIPMEFYENDDLRDKVVQAILLS